MYDRHKKMLCVGATGVAQQQKPCLACRDHVFKAQHRNNEVSKWESFLLHHVLLDSVTEIVCSVELLPFSLKFMANLREV